MALNNVSIFMAIMATVLLMEMKFASGARGAFLESKEDVNEFKSRFPHYPVIYIWPANYREQHPPPFMSAPVKDMAFKECIKKLRHLYSQEEANRAVCHLASNAADHHNRQGLESITSSLLTTESIEKPRHLQFAEGTIEELCHLGPTNYGTLVDIELETYLGYSEREIKLKVVPRFTLDMDFWVFSRGKEGYTAGDILKLSDEEIRGEKK